MKKIGFNLVLGIVFFAFFSSCLDINDETKVPTLAEEQMSLNTYIETLISNGDDVDTTEMGIYYVMMEEGEGEFAQTNDTLTVGYAGYFIDGYQFDASAWHNQVDSTYTFILGNPPKIEGWDEGMKILNKNAIAQLIVPSEFAYGSEGSGIIPPYTTLVFVVKMIDIKPSN